MRAKTANEDIQIDFSLEAGKSWSNVVKYYFGDSYFHERFNNDTALAAVRGTVFEVNLDHKYIHTIDHAVSIEDIWSHTGSTLIVAGWILDTDTRKVLVKDTIDEVWNKVNNDADVIYLNEKMESLKKEILSSAGKLNYLHVFLQKTGLRKVDPSLDLLLDGNTKEWEQFENRMKKWGDSDRLMDIYQQFYGLGNTEKLIDTRTRLRDLIIETATPDRKKVFLDDFARSTLYDSWSAIKIGTGSIEGLQKKIENYIQQWADKQLIDGLKNAAQQDSIQKLNDSFEGGKQDIIKVLGEKNLLEEAKKEISIEKINNAATDIRHTITDELKKFTP